MAIQLAYFAFLLTAPTMILFFRSMLSQLPFCYHSGTSQLASSSLTPFSLFWEAKTTMSPINRAACLAVVGQLRIVAFRTTFFLLDVLSFSS